MIIPSFSKKAIDSWWFPILLGFFTFSNLTDYLSSRMGLPFSMPEFFFMFFYLYDRKNKIKVFFPEEELHFVVIICMLFFCLGVTNFDFTIYGIVNTLRVHLYIMLFFILFRHNSIFNLKFLFKLSLGVVLGTMIVAYFTLQYRLGLASNKEWAINSNIIAVTFLVGIAVLKGNWMQNILVLLLAFITCFLSASRGVIVFYALSYIIALSLKISTNRKYMVYIPLILLVVWGISNSVNYLEPVVQDISPTMHHRLYTKTKDNINQESTSSDDTRSSNIVYILEQIPNRILPSGFVDKSQVEKLPLELWSLRDLPFNELLYMYGTPVLLILYLIYIRKSAGLLFKFYRQREDVSGVLFVSSLVFFVAIFIGGGLLERPYFSPFIGIFLGMAFKRSDNRLLMARQIMKSFT
ncbi:MAG: hypothetical protein H6Q14_1456 [Bacteroidetes bacterium]|nr:hypothetical protein [Bacteroidota bacterium]